MQSRTLYTRLMGFRPGMLLPLLLQFQILRIPLQLLAPLELRQRRLHQK